VTAAPPATRETGLAIRVHDLSKQYGETRAVDGVSFEVRSGEVFGLLGPNGAGKTTTVEILAGQEAGDKVSATSAPRGRARRAAGDRRAGVAG